MIRTIVSDLGNVLLRFDHMHACRQLAKLCRLSPEQIYDSMFESDLVREYDLGLISSSEFALRTRERLSVDLEIRILRDVWSDIFHPIQGMEELVRGLKGRYALVLLSNTNEWHFEHCQSHFPVVRLFEHFALSYRLQSQKPSPVVYRKALAMAEALPEETLYVDDIPAYVESARRLGMKAIRFQDSEQLSREMTSEGIICP